MEFRVLAKLPVADRPWAQIITPGFIFELVTCVVEFVLNETDNIYIIKSATMKPL